MGNVNRSIFVIFIAAGVCLCLSLLSLLFFFIDAVPSPKRTNQKQDKQGQDKQARTVKDRHGSLKKYQDTEL